MEEKDCIYPDCQIKTDFGLACEHSCPFERDKKYKLRGWKHEQCSICYGTGMVSDYGMGYDFEGPKECDTCCGNGAYWVTPKGRHVLYPGGPFC